MSLVELIRQHALAAAEAGNWQSVANALNALTTPVVDQQAWTYAKIGQQLGSDVQLAVSRFMAAGAKSGDVDLEMAHQLLLLGDGEKTGLRLDETSRQSKLQTLIDSIPDAQVKAILTAVRSLGRRDVAVLTTPVTAAECMAAWDVNVRAQRNTNLKTRFDGILNQLGTAEHASGIAALRSMANELEAV